FQAEDGIRDFHVTGVQTCALPILKVRADLYGIHMGGGVYGANDLKVDFKIGREQIVKADTQKHRMVVYRDGKKVADYPASFGLRSEERRVGKDWSCRR